MSFSDLFTGNNKTLDSDINGTGGLGKFLGANGTRDVSTASNFLNTLLSGNSAATSKLLAPAISDITTRAQQQRQQAGQFQGRSGGTTAATYAATDDVHKQINDYISKLTGGAVNSLATLGTTETGQAANDEAIQANLSQQRLKNLQESIFGQGITGGILGGEAIGLGAAGKAAGLSSFFK